MATGRATSIVPVAVSAIVIDRVASFAPCTVPSALHFVFTVDFGVDAQALAVLGENSTRVTEINATHQLADNHQVGAAHAFWLYG